MMPPLLDLLIIPLVDLLCSTPSTTFVPFLWSVLCHSFSFLSFLAFSMVALPLMGRLYPQLPVWSTPPKLQNHMSFCLVIRRGSHSYRKGVISNYSAPSSNIRRICKVSVIFQLPSPQTETVHNYPPTSAISISLKLLWWTLLVMSPKI